MEIDNIEQAITALGAICELAGFMFKQLIKNGFEREEAYNIAAEYILRSLLGNKDNEQEETDE